jgi:Ca2+-binding EF-hand superfamily protein
MNKTAVIGILAGVGVAGTLAMVFAGGSNTPPADLGPAPVTPEPVLAQPEPIAIVTPDVQPEGPRGEDRRRGDRGGREGWGGPGGDWNSPEARQRMEEWLSRLSPEERAAAEKRMADMQKAMLARFDKDGDGVISDAEREEARKEREQREAERRAEMRSRAEQLWGGPVPLTDRELQAAGRIFMEQLSVTNGEEMRNMWRNADADGDGNVTDAEQQAVRARFETLMNEQMMRMQQDLLARFDADGDGALSDGERDTAAEGVRADIRDASTMRMFDANRDGRIDESELGTFTNSFDSSDQRADLNRDGNIDSTDFDRFIQMLQRR